MPVSLTLLLATRKSIGKRPLGRYYIYWFLFDKFLSLRRHTRHLRLPRLHITTRALALYTVREEDGISIC